VGRRYKTVSDRIPFLRRQVLSFSHHAEVATLPPEGRDTWLDRAENLKPFAGERIFTLKHHAEVEGDDKGNRPH
jgi:hypothetical protein